MMLTKEEVQKELIEDSRIFHFGTLSSTHEGVREATRHAIELAKEAGCIITFDPESPPSSVEFSGRCTQRDRIRNGKMRCTENF